jgi:hypothetical protein
MKLFWVALCVGAAAFLLRVLVALLNELKSPAHRALRVHHATFRPSSHGAELVEMRSDAVTGRFKTGHGQRVAVFVLVCLGVAKTASTVATLIKF